MKKIKKNSAKKKPLVKKKVKKITNKNHKKNLNKQIINIGPDEEYVTINKVSQICSNITGSNLKPIFVDCEIETLQIDIKKIEEKVQSIYKNEGERELSIDVDQSLYDGFISDNDRAICNQIQSLVEEEIKHFEPKFEDRKSVV